MKAPEQHEGKGQEHRFIHPLLLLFPYLIFACTVSESSRFMGRGVTDPDAMQLVPGRLILIDPFP